MQRQANLDQTEVNVTLEEKNKYLLLALENYCRALATNGKHTLIVSRLISIWFSNSTDKEVNKILKAFLSKIDPALFVPLLYQIAARLGQEKGDEATFQGLLRSLILRCADQHPFHSLPVILALVNANADDKEMGLPETVNSRGVAAKEMLAKLRSSTKDKKDIIDKMDFTSKALIKLAYTPIPQSGDGSNKRKIDSKLPIAKVRGFEDIPIPTVDMPIRPRGDYSRNLVGLVKYEGFYEMVGGINAPKKINCYGTDGKRRIQLVKGRDDLRQDAVMQQVFGLMNTLLKKDKTTSVKKLMIRQYKVVPLSQRSGVLEWVDQTTTLR
jgi:ataxia telangiectasia mutated family protein